MEVLHWKEVAVALLTVLNGAAFLTLRSVFSQLGALRTALVDFERRAADTFARRDHLEQQLSLLIHMVNRLDDKINRLTEK